MLEILKQENACVYKKNATQNINIIITQYNII